MLFTGILIIGFIVLIKGADLFVDGSSALARNFKVPGLIIGLTIVAAGTSAPELAVSTVAATQGSNEIALSNVIGSNIFNLLLVLGLCAVIHPVPAEAMVLKRDFPFSIATTALMFFLSCTGFLFSGQILKTDMGSDVGNIGRIAGTFFIVLFLVYIIHLIITAKKHPQQEDTVNTKPIWKCALLIVVGLALIVGGGEAVVRGAKGIARALGMTETLIGLTVVAVGTSLPELVTSVVAARRGETGLAVGNVIGSNIFNLLFILGISAVIHPVVVNAASAYDLAILFFVSLLTFLFLRNGRSLERWEGITMLALYAATMAFAVVR